MPAHHQMAGVRGEALKQPFTVIALGALLIVVTAGLTQSFWQKYLPTPSARKTPVQLADWSKPVDKIIVHKQDRRLELWSGQQRIKSYVIRLGFNPVAAKQFEGDGRTPEGLYRIDYQNPHSQFYKSLHVSYPSQRDTADAQRQGRSAGGDIMIHGSMKRFGGSPGQPLYDYLPQQDWTLGCIAVSNQDMDEIFRAVPVGTPIEILP